MTPLPMAPLPRFDTAAIVAAHDLAAELERRGHRVRHLAGGRAKLRCPFHQPDDDPSCYIFPDGHLHCFGCGAHGTIIDLVMWECGRLHPGSAVARPGRLRGRLPAAGRWRRLSASATTDDEASVATSALGGAHAG
jgi:hypothetical protein